MKLMKKLLNQKEKLTRREKRGLLLALFGATIYLLIFIYNIIPNVPFGGNFLIILKQDILINYLDMIHSSIVDLYL